MDQAQTLRKLAGERQERPRPVLPGAGSGRPRVIAMTSGKGGVGKTNLVLNLAISLAALQRQVFVLDADMGLANVDVLLGLTPPYTLEHVMKGQREVSEVVVTGPRGVRILPSSSGISEMSEMSYEEQMRLFQELSRLDEDIDYLFIDTGAGISSNVLRFNASAGEVVVVANPEPTAITDAYALIKLLAIKYHVRDFSLIANSVRSEADGQAVYERLNGVCTQFLRISLNFLGSVPFDEYMHKAVRKQVPLVESFPSSPAAKSIRRIAAVLDQRPALTRTLSSGPVPTPAEPASSLPAFWDRLLHWKKSKE
ncbi:MAG: MinD/ParA family protein [Deltaproteobacteria bacterium]|nr:MinD/ParA family protein [Deltaproteobacteria bacterium]